MGQKVQLVGGMPVDTITYTHTDDTVQQFTAAALSRLGAARVDDKHDTFHIMLSVETSPIRFAFGVDPVPDVSGKQVEPGQDIHISSRAQARLFRWCNGIAGSNATVHQYPEVD